MIRMRIGKVKARTSSLHSQIVHIVLGECAHPVSEQPALDVILLKPVVAMVQRRGRGISM